MITIITIGAIITLTTTGFGRRVEVFICGLEDEGSGFGGSESRALLACTKSSWQTEWQVWLSKSSRRNM